MNRTPVEVVRHFVETIVPWTGNDLKKALATTAIAIGLMFGAGPANAQLPKGTMQIDREHTALVVIDPQVDFLSPKGVTWSLVGKSVEANHTVENIEILFKVAKANNIPVFISPHYYYPWDHKWESGGVGEMVMHQLGMFDRKGPLTLEGFQNSGADWMPQYKPYINDGITVIASPHKVYGPEANDLVLQLRKRGITKVILAGMSANLCVESHLRHLLEQGFEIAVVRDATAAFQLPGLDGYAAALTNYQMIANAVMTTEEVKDAVNAQRASK
jgi:nicotinamidase-related amidase